MNREKHRSFPPAPTSNIGFPNIDILVGPHAKQSAPAREWRMGWPRSLARVREFCEPLRGGLRAECRGLFVPLTAMTALYTAARRNIGHDADVSRHYSVDRRASFG